MGKGPEAAPNPIDTGEAQEVQAVAAPDSAVSVPEKTPEPTQPPPSADKKEIRPTDKDIDPDYKEVREKIRQRQREESERLRDQRSLGKITHLENIVKENREASPEDIIDIIQEFDFAEVKQIESERKHGKGFMGAIRKFLDSDSAYEIREIEEVNAETGLTSKREEVRYNAWRDLLSRGTKAVFNRRTAISAAATAAVGVITGGTSLAAGAVVAGGSIGRMSAELIDIFKGEDAVKGGTRGARREILIAESEKWFELKQLAADYQEQKEGDPHKANEILEKITQLYYKQGESAVVQRINAGEKSLEQREKKLNKLRGALQTVGELAGVGAYATYQNLSGSFDAVDLDLFGKVEGQSVFHSVQQFGDSYRFMWTEADKAMGFGGNTLNHFLGKTAGTTSELLIASIAERGLPVVMASALLGGWSYRRSEKGAVEQSVAQAQRDNKFYENIHGQIDTPTEYLRKVAFERREEGVFFPQSPDNLKFDWLQQPQSIPREDFSFEKMPTWVLNEAFDPNTGNKVEGLVVDPTSGSFVEVGVAAVNVEENKIAIVKYERNPATGATVYPVYVMRIDDFMRKYRPIIKQQPGQPFNPASVNPDDSGPTPTPAPDRGNPVPENPDGQSSMPQLPELPPESNFPELQPINPDEQPPDFQVGDAVNVRRGDKSVEKGWQIIKFFKDGDELGALCFSPDGKSTKRVPVEKLREANRRSLAPSTYEQPQHRDAEAYQLQHDLSSGSTPQESDKPSGENTDLEKELLDAFRQEDKVINETDRDDKDSVILEANKKENERILNEIEGVFDKIFSLNYPEEELAKLGVAYQISRNSKNQPVKSFLLRNLTGGTDKVMSVVGFGKEGRVALVEKTGDEGQFELTKDLRVDEIEDFVSSLVDRLVQLEGSDQESSAEKIDSSSTIPAVDNEDISPATNFQKSRIAGRKKSGEGRGRAVGEDGRPGSFKIKINEADSGEETDEEPEESVKNQGVTKKERVEPTGERTQALSNFLEKNAILDPDLLAGTQVSLDLSKGNGRATELRRTFNIPEGDDSIDLTVGSIEPQLDGAGNTVNYALTVSNAEGESRVTLPLTEIVGLIK